MGIAIIGALGCSRDVGKRNREDPLTPPAAKEVSTPTPPPSPEPPPVPTTPPDFASLPAYAFDKSNPDSLCREEWTKRGELNTQMFNYCVGKETKGYGEIKEVLKKFGKQPWMTTLFPATWAEWTKRGVTQYSMVAYNLKKESDKFLDYEYETKQATFDAAKMSRCARQWQSHSSRWSMTMHCYKND